MKHLLEKAEEVANEVFDLIESTDWDEVIEEGSGGTPVDPIAAVPSKDRAKVEDYYKYFKNVAPKGWTVELRGLQIVITMDKYSQPGPLHDPSTYDNTPNQTPLPEQEEKTIDYAPFIADILEYMHKQGMNIKPIPNVVIKKDKNEAVDIFGKTAYYQPQDKEIVLFVLGRHPKDVLRSFCHEMIHHIQNIEGRLDQSKINTSNTQENDYVDQLEQEAHGKGSYLFRSWEDSRKAADINPLEEEQEIDPEELKIGEKEELEHTKDPKVARQIAIDHLKEDPKYYSKLKQAGLVGEVSQEDAKKKVIGTKVSRNGEPVVVWRSQKDDRQATGQRRSNTFGIYFSEDKESTKIYGNKTKPYYVNLKNPIILKDKEWNLSIITRPTLYGLEQKGYDGAIWLRNGVMYEVVAFSPDQVVALEDFKEPLNEGSYTQIVSALARNILNDWKNQFEQAKGSKIEQVENFFTVGKGQDIPTDKFPGVIQVASYLYFDNDQVDLEVSADADPDFNDKDRGQVADIEINFAISPDSLPGYWEEIYMNLVEVLRHEIEHTTQTGPNVKPGKYLPSDEELRGAIEMGVMKPVNYFLLPKEIPAMIQGMYMAAKKRRVPFKDFVNQSLQYYVDGEYLKPKDVQTILNVWRKHLPKLGIKQEL